MPRSPFIRDLLTGLVAICAIIGLVILLWRFGELYRFTRKTYPLYVRMSSVNGLSATSGVTLNGVHIGEISDVVNTDEGVLITMKIREKNHIPRGMTAYVDRSFVGEGTLDFRPPSEPDAAEMKIVLDSEDTFPSKDKPPFKATSMISEITESFKGPVASMGRAADRIETLATTLDDAAKKFSEMIEPRTLAEVDSGQKQPNLRTALARADIALASANKWLGDDAALSDAKSALTKLNKTMEDAQKLPATIDKAVSDTTAKVSDASTKLSAAIEQAQTTMKSIEDASTRLKDLAQGVQNGEGSLGQFVRNPDLYNNLNEAARRLEAALEEASQLIEKFKKEGLPLKLK